MSISARTGRIIPEVAQMGLIVLIVVLMLVVGALPTFGRHDYGYAPSGIGGLILLIIIILLLTGRM